MLLKPTTRYGKICHAPFPCVGVVKNLLPHPHPKSFHACTHNSKQRSVPASATPRGSSSYGGGQDDENDGKKKMRKSSRLKRTSSSTSSRDLLGSLNEEQITAVQDPNDAIYVKAGPGTGKTRVITARIQNLIQSGVDPRSLLAFTFTNKAAAELQERLRNLLSNKAPIRASTFHGTCLMILTADNYNIEDLGIRISKDFVIFDEEDTKDALRTVVQNQVYFGHLETNKVPQIVECLSSAFGVVKNLVPTTVGTNMVPVFDKALQEKKVAIPSDPALFGFEDPRTLAKLFGLYQLELVASNALDFSDIISYSVALLCKPPVQQFYNSKFTHILIDEFQDTNAPQFALAKLLKGKSGSLFAVGDDDQMIYSWRGTDAAVMGSNFSAEWPHRSFRVLSGNYRSSQEHLDVASSVLSHGGAPPNHKTLQALSGHPGAVHHVSVTGGIQGLKYEEAEARAVAKIVGDAIAKGIPRAEIAILYRMKLKYPTIVKRLRLDKIPHFVIGKKSLWKEKVVKVAMSFLDLITKPVSSQYAFSADLERILKTPIGKGFGEKGIDALQKRMWQERGMGLDQLIFGDLLEVWMKREDVVKVVDSVANAAKKYSCGVVQRVTVGDLTKLQAQQKEDMDAATAAVQSVVPELTEADLPDVKDVKVRRVINDLRRLLVLGRSAARFLQIEDALLVFLEAGRYRLSVHKGDSYKDRLFVQLLLAVQKQQQEQQREQQQRDQRLRGQQQQNQQQQDQHEQQQASGTQPPPESQKKQDQATQTQLQPPLESQVQGHTPATQPPLQVQVQHQTPEAKSGQQLKDDVEFTRIRNFRNKTKLWQMEDEEEPGDRVRLMTIHASKGTEYSLVIICGMHAGHIPKAVSEEMVAKGARLPMDLEEEKRLAFVACTRVKEQLYLIGPAPGITDGSRDNKPVMPSPFTAELQLLELTQPGTVKFICRPDL